MWDLRRTTGIHVAPLGPILFLLKAQYTPQTPTRRNCRVESRRRCVRNSQLVGDSFDESEQICQQRVELRLVGRYERTGRQSS